MDARARAPTRLPRRLACWLGLLATAPGCDATERGDPPGADSAPSHSLPGDSLAGDSLPADTGPSATDVDGDGYAEPQDCDDQDASVHPGAFEYQDGLDNDCDGLTDRTPLAEAHALLLGEEAGDYAGHSLAGAGDLDGDGHDDLLVGAPCRDDAGESAGAAYVVLGPVSGSSSLAETQRLHGESAGDLAGLQLAGIGDFWGSAAPALLVGAGGHDGAAADAGAAYLLARPLEKTSLAEAELLLLGAAAGEEAGEAVAGAGDVDGDGLPDLLVGAPNEASAGSAAGAAYLVCGALKGELSLAQATARLRAPTAGCYAGKSVASAGDVDGDGYGDVLVGGPGWSAARGACWLLLGPLEGERDLVSADGALYGAGAGDALGMAVAGAGDVDGDGCHDLLVGAMGGAGAAFLVLGPLQGTLAAEDADAVFEGQAEGDYAGFSLDAAGDLNGDGSPDLLAGVPQGPPSASESEQPGQAWLLAAGHHDGLLGEGASDLRFDGEAAGDRAGLAVAGAGDVDGDGLSDALAGAYQNDAAGDSAGAVYLLLGSAF